MTFLDKRAVHVTERFVHTIFRHSQVITNRALATDYFFLLKQPHKRELKHLTPFCFEISHTKTSNKASCSSRSSHKNIYWSITNYIVRFRLSIPTWIWYHQFVGFTVHTQHVKANWNLRSIKRSSFYKGDHKWNFIAKKVVLRRKF